MLRVLCFPPRPPFVSINHGPGGVPSRMGRCSCTHCHAPCTRARNSSSSSSSSLLSHPRPLEILPPPASSRRLACARSSLSAFLCGFAVLFRLVFFFFPLRPTATPLSSRPPFTFLFPPPLTPKRAPLLFGSPA